jgi:hypothetical protein
MQIYTEDIHNILNCQNVAKHCKFDARGTVVYNTATATVHAVEIKMATFKGAERARGVFGSKKPRPTIYSWHKNFVENGCSVRHAKSPGRPCVSHATVELLTESFVRRPRKSTRRVSGNW